MTPSIIRRDAAKRDLLEIARRLAERESVEVAGFFLDGAEKTFAFLAASPTSGRELPFAHAELAGLRAWRLAGFETRTVFYRPKIDGVEIIRVVEDAGDLDALG